MSEEWTSADEAADLVEKLAFEQLTRPERLGLLGHDTEPTGEELTGEAGLEDVVARLVDVVRQLGTTTSDTFYELGRAAGYDASVMLRLARLVQSQEQALVTLREEVDELKGRL